MNHLEFSIFCIAKFYALFIDCSISVSYILNMTNKELITVSNDGDNWACLCGNDTVSSGFDTYDENGAYNEPINGVWTGLYACLKCRRVIDQDTYIVVSKTDYLSSFGITNTQ